MTYDDQIFTGQRVGGVARYFTHLLEEFERDDRLNVTPVTPFRYIVNEHLLGADPERFRLPTNNRLFRRGAAMRAMNAARAGTLVRRAELLHHTYFLPRYLWLPAKVRVCTVYDMIPELFPGTAPPHLAKERYVRSCDAVMCISQTTKDDLLRIYGSLDKPVEVTPLAVAPDYYAAATDAGHDQYFLYVGRREMYKNFDVVLRAFGRIEKAAGSTLVCVGGGPLRATEQQRIAQLGLSGRVSQRAASDAEMPSIYARAIALTFPSRYEGFGLPIVEAFAAGCPAIVADTPCSIEVSGGAAPVFGEDDDEALAAIMASLVADQAARRRWVELARARAQDFSWRRTAELTAAVYREVAR